MDKLMMLPLYAGLSKHGAYEVLWRRLHPSQPQEPPTPLEVAVYASLYGDTQQFDREQGSQELALRMQ